jgi:hypothetical protein
MAKFSAKDLFRRNDTECTNLTVDNSVIEEKLEEARLRSARRRTWTTVALLVTISLCGLALFGLSALDFTAKKNPSVVASQAEKFSEKFSEEFSEIEREKYRGEFKELLQQYENEMVPRLQAANVEQWKREALLEIDELKKQALLDFSNGAYLNALANIQSLKAKTGDILQEADDIFRENMKKAKAYLAEDQYDEAKFHLEKVLMVSSQSPEASELQQKTEQFSTLLPFLDGAKAARAEKDQQKEHDFLQQVLKLAPERENIAARLKELEDRIKKQKFDVHISSGFMSIENNQAQNARHHYQEAKNVDPERSELPVLLDQVSTLEKSLRVQEAVNQAENAVRQDDWQQAKNYYTKILQDAPEKKNAVEGLKRAEQILELQARFSQYIYNPYRLTHKEVRQEAEKALVLADGISVHSFSIKSQAKQLRELIQQINRFVPVTVISDNQTFVSVRSVGKVGVVSQKVIQLNPGEYTFEGAREGFKSKLVQAFIPYDQDHFSLHVICDEPI